MSFMIRRSFQDPFIRGFSASAPRIWYAYLLAKPRCRYQLSTANSKISYKACNWHAKRDCSSWAFIPCNDLITAFKIFIVLLGIDPNLFFLLLDAVQGTPRWEPPLKQRVCIFGEGCEILEFAPGLRRYSSLCQYFQEKVGESLGRSHFPSPPLNEHSSPHSPTPPSPHVTSTPPINSYPLYMLPKSLFCVCDSGPFLPAFYHYKPY